MRIGIIGYGLLGRFAALVCAQRGYEVEVWERQAYPLEARYKAGRLDARAYQMLLKLGLKAQDLAAICQPILGTAVQDQKQRILLRYAYPKQGPLAPQYSFQQPKLEVLLDQALNRYKNLKIHYQAEIQSFELAGEQVLVKDQGGSSIGLDYVWVCEGQNSKTAQILDLEYSEWGYEKRLVYYEIAAAKASQANVELETWALTLCDSSRPFFKLQHRDGSQRWAVEYEAGEEAWPESPEGLDLGARVLSVYVQDLKVQLLERWQVFERVFFLGDAAHVLPPYLGMGLAAAWDDVLNLVWKCEWVKARQADEVLLRSYQMEREGLVRRAIGLNLSLRGLFPRQLGRLRRYVLPYLPERWRYKSLRNPKAEEGFWGLDGGFRGQLCPNFALRGLDGGEVYLWDLVYEGGFLVLGFDASPVDALWVGDLDVLRRLGAVFVHILTEPRGDFPRDYKRFCPLYRALGGDLALWLGVGRRRRRYVLLRPDGFIFDAARDEVGLDAGLARWFGGLGGEGWD